ncbi:hypothetical protein [Streptomyces gossypiisoli]|uniref:hypothetical protein n=1 Tax=Streptomyces gossypiisoli TaxID=2748864 RepID=UPI0015DA8AD2|nr:hypothetical protein [Streptomyces gossypiisoli]
MPPLWRPSAWGRASPNLVVVAESRTGSVDGPAARTAGGELTRRLAAQPHVSAVTSYWTGGAAELRSRDGHAAESDLKRAEAVVLPGTLSSGLSPSP